MTTSLCIAEALGTNMTTYPVVRDRCPWTEHSTLLDRLMMAAKGLDHSDLEAIVVQVEALPALRKFKSGSGA